MRRLTTTGFCLALLAAASGHAQLGLRLEPATQSESWSGLRLLQASPNPWTANFEFSSSEPGEAFQRYALRALAGKQFDSGWGVQFGVQRLGIHLERADSQVLSIVRRFGDQRLDLSFYSGNQTAGIAVPGRRLQWSYLFGQRGSIGLALASGYESDSGASADTRNLTVFSRYWITPAWAFSAEAVAHEPGSFQPRHLFRFGLHHRF